jgi:TatD DNase family protein
MDQRPTLDAHAHLSSAEPDEFVDSGCVLAMTLSLDEALVALERPDSRVAWGAGCHPRRTSAQEKFDIGRFREMVERTAIVGEIGLDSGSRVPLELQLRTFRQILETVAQRPRFVSIHSYRASELVLQELRRTPIVSPVLHWWTGTAAETSQAVELGCYFSIHSAVARHSKFRTRVPRERILVESDHGYRDPAAAIPCRIEWAEHLVAQQFKLAFKEVRDLAWRNFARIIHDTQTEHLLPTGFGQLLRDVAREDGL